MRGTTRQRRSRPWRREFRARLRFGVADEGGFRLAFVELSRGGSSRVLPFGSYIELPDDAVANTVARLVTRREAIAAAARWRKAAN